MSSGPVTLVPPPGDEAQTQAQSAEEVISEDALRAMSRTQLLDLCRQNDVRPPDEIGADQDLLLEWLLDSFGV